jgi:hypothetical protein
MAIDNIDKVKALLIVPEAFTAHDLVKMGPVAL